MLCIQIPVCWRFLDADLLPYSDYRCVGSYLCSNFHLLGVDACYSAGHIFVQYPNQTV